MHLDRSKSPPVHFYSLGGETLYSVTEAKYLGLTLFNKYGTSSSQWRAHIVATASKANQNLGFLKRNLRGSPYKLRELGYISLVRSTLEYCGAIWDPTAKDDIYRLEIVQRRADRWARGAHGIISVTALLSELNWVDLTDRRRNQRLCSFYKLLHGEWNVEPESLDLNLDTSTRTRRSHQFKIKHTSGKDRNSPIWKGTISRTIPEWNSLPATTVSADSITTFKSRLKSNP